MKFTVSAVLALVGHLSHVQGTSIKMDFLPIGHVRTDPILSKDCLSGHVHSFYGARVLPHPATTDYESLRAVDNTENTGNVEENKSLYWHPSIYSYDETTDTFTRVEMAQTSAYYIWATGNARVFPNGFQMIGGMPGPGTFPNAEAECVGPTPSDRPACPASFGNIDFFPNEACIELETSMSFPSCWNGEDLTSPNGRDHVAYTTNGDVEGPCPDGFPVRIPQIQFFFRIMPYAGGCHTFSDMTQTFHADYVSGWDEEFLQQVLDECSNESFAASPDAFCDAILTFRDGPKCSDESVCDFGDPSLLQKLRDIQPPALDMTSITTEETKTVVGSLPGGPTFESCAGPGSLLPPTPAAILAPSPHPTFFAFDNEDNEDEVGQSEDEDEQEEEEDEEDQDEEDLEADKNEEDHEEDHEDEEDMEEDNDEEDHDEDEEDMEEEGHEDEDSDNENEEDGDAHCDEHHEAFCFGELEGCADLCEEEEEGGDIEDCYDEWCVEDFESCMDFIGCR